MFFFILILLPLFPMACIVISKTMDAQNRRNRKEKTVHTAFFHPYCNAGGGGERVLWSAIKGLQTRYPSVEIFIYTNETASSEAILAKVHQRFGIKLKAPKFIRLTQAKWMKASSYPVATLLLQSLGSIVVALEAYMKLCPDIYIDTTGFTFTNIVFKYLANAHIICYTHYPIISIEMVTKVLEKNEAYNNKSFIVESSFLSSLKIYYYKLFAVIYGVFGRMNDVIMVNSSWTEAHIKSLWSCPHKISLVYPPCDLESFNITRSPDSSHSPKSIVSIGQFRPEKDYPLQLRSFKILVDMITEDVNLVLIGGVRNEDDERRVEELQDLAESLGISDKVKFMVNASYQDLLTEVKNGTIGLHSMWNEHFGISVVECMAGGLVMLAHNSGGPKMDIVCEASENQTGFLASTPEEYARKMKQILDMSDQERDTIRKAAILSSKRFGEDVFIDKFVEVTETIFQRTIESFS